MNLNKFLCSILTVTVASLGLPSPFVSSAMADTCSSYNVGGSSTTCAMTKTGSAIVGIPRVQWTAIGSPDVLKERTMATQSAPTGDQLPSSAHLDTTGLDLNDLRGNDAASVLNFAPGQIAAAINSFPSNVPLVVGRYEPLSKTLHVDIFKLEHQVTAPATQAQPFKLELQTTAAPSTTSVMYRAPFTPANGKYWSAMGSYLSPLERQNGSAVGPDPFQAFGTTDDFVGISLDAALVVLGHAQRFSGAPVSMLIKYVPAPNQYTTKSGNWFRKTVTTHVDHYTQPEYYLGAARGMQGGISYSFCANDPTATSCYSHQTAKSGVTFMKLDGGNMDSTKELISTWQTSQSGWTLLAIFVLVLVVSFAFALIGPALAATGASVGGGAVGGLSTSVTAGFWTNALSVVGVEGASTAASAALLEAGIYTGVTGALGGGFGGVYGTPLRMVYANSVGFETAAAPSHVSVREYRDKMLASGAVTGAVDSAIPSVKSQLVGACGEASLLKSCGAATTGIIPRADQYLTFDSVDFVRDNGKPARASSF